MTDFSSVLLAWFDRHGRHDPPWQHPRDPYRVWLAEVMLQQTQVATVIGYFQRFVAALPSLATLADVDEDRVLALWSGLGYYRRARQLHQAARICVREHAGTLPRDYAALVALPGIGRSTAGAILAQAHGLRLPILDGNVKRVLTRFHGVDGWPGAAVVERELWRLADTHTPRQRVADYTQAIMDLGATVCVRSRPRCEVCPLAADCTAHRQARTTELPARRPAKPKPLRTTHMLVLVDRDGRILLERRGVEGVWPGLWSLPEAAADASARAARLARLDKAKVDEYPGFEHVFSHFRLHITPVAWRGVAHHHAIADNVRLRWCSNDEWPLLGLPAPVRRLLETLVGETPCPEPCTA